VKARREFVADSFIGFTFDLCIHYGGSYGIRGASGGYDAAALCLPPGVVRGGVTLPWWRLLALMWRAGLPPVMRSEHAAVFGDMVRPAGRPPDAADAERRLPHDSHVLGSRG
jgi:hypothetical protein